MLSERGLAKFDLTIPCGRACSVLTSSYGGHMTTEKCTMKATELKNDPAFIGRERTEV